ncbi:putative MATE efflux family protein 9-like [Capsicum annuum]|nr:putative MATE efflux family protein 9-like [Capsicum annuum]
MLAHRAKGQNGNPRGTAIVTCRGERPVPTRPFLVNHHDSGAKPVHSPMKINAKFTTVNFDEHIGNTSTNPPLQDPNSSKRLIGRLFYLTVQSQASAFLFSVGERAFCSVECRCKQILMDEEESIKTKKRDKKPQASTTSSNKSCTSSSSSSSSSRSKKTAARN